MAHPKERSQKWEYSQDLDNLYVVWEISKRKLKLIVFMVLRLLSRWDVKDCTRNLNYKTCGN